MGTDTHPNGVAAELEKVLSSQSFANSSQGSRLLRFVVERTLEGRADEIKESVLGVEVFGRQSFDPRTDPIARVEASRLRQKLTKYYESEGKQDAVRIILPKGSYVPVFEPIVERVASPPTGSRSRREQLAWVTAAIFAAIALALGLAYLRLPTQDVEVRKLSLLPPAQAGFLGQPSNISPDGRLLVFVAAAGSQQLLWIRPMNSLEAWALLGTEDATYPFWSPDSRSVGFFARGKLKRVDVAGGAVQTVCGAERGFGGAWNRDGVILFCPREVSALYRVPAGGGTPTPLTERDVSRREAAHRWPQFLPDGKHFIFLARSRQMENQAIYLGTLDSRERIRLIPARSNAVWAQLGRQTACLLFVREGSLLGQRIDTSRFQAVGEPFPVAGPVGSGFDRADFSVSENGVLAYSSNVGAVTEQLLWRDRGGKQIGSVSSVSSPGNQYVYPSLSPDGKMLATSILDWDAMMYSLWLFDLAHGVPSRFTFDHSTWAVWSPDGKQIAFSMDRKEGHGDLYLKASNGTSAERLLLASSISKTPTDWSSDGKFLLFNQEQPKTKRDVWILPLSGDGKPFPILQTTADEYAARFSPDGRWIAYTSDESGREEVYVQSFPVGGGKRKISHQGGSWPVWRRDGNELFYVSADRQVMAAALADKTTFTFDLPKPLFPATRGRLSGFSVTADGQRFLMNVRNEEKQYAPVTVVINWTAGIR